MTRGQALLAGLALLLGVASPRSAVAQSGSAGAKTPAKPGAASVGAPTSMSVKRLPLAVTDIADIVTLEKLEDRRDFDAATLQRISTAKHPELRRRAALAIARLYDLQADPARIDRMTFESPSSGGRVSRLWQLPRSRRDLAERRLARGDERAHDAPPATAGSVDVRAGTAASSVRRARARWRSF